MMLADESVITTAFPISDRASICSAGSPGGQISVDIVPCASALFFVAKKPFLCLAQLRSLLRQTGINSAYPTETQPSFAESAANSDEYRGGSITAVSREVSFPDIPRLELFGDIGVTELSLLNVERECVSLFSGYGAT